MSETITQTTEVKVKKKRGKKVLKVLGIILGVIVVAAGVCAIVSAIGSSGNLKGYPAGVEKKIWLMRHEGIDPSRFYSPASVWQ